MADEIDDRDFPERQQHEPSETDGNGTVVIDDIYDIVRPMKEYTVTRCTFEKEPCLLICHEKLYCHPPFGITSRCRISIKGSEFVVNILMKERETTESSCCVRFTREVFK